MIANNMCSTSSTPPQETLLFKEGRFEYHTITPFYRDPAHVVLSRAFCTEPAVDGLAEINPEMATSYLEWLEFVDYWMDGCSSNGMGVVALGKAIFTVYFQKMSKPSIDLFY